jgi:4-oxalmesaconate hydratase
LPKDAESFDTTLRRFWFDTVLHNRQSLKLLFDVVGAGRCLFGTERPGSGGGIDPATGRPYDDLKPVIESIESLTVDDRAGIFGHNARHFFRRLDA